MMAKRWKILKTKEQMLQTERTKSIFLQSLILRNETIPEIKVSKEKQKVIILKEDPIVVGEIIVLLIIENEMIFLLTIIEKKIVSHLTVVVQEINLQTGQIVIKETIFLLKYQIVIKETIFLLIIVI